MAHIVGASVAEAIVAILGGFAAVVVFGLYARGVVVAHLQRGRLRERRDPIFIGGARFHATGGTFSGARWNLTSPLARLELRDDGILLSLHDLGRTLGQKFEPPVQTVTTLNFVEIESFDIFGNGGIRFRTGDPDDERDGLVFWPSRRDRAILVERLKEVGLQKGSHSGRRSHGTGTARSLRREIMLTLPLLTVCALGAAIFGWHVSLLIAVVPAVFWALIVVADHRRH